MILKKRINVFNLLKVTQTVFYLHGSFGSQFICIPWLLSSKLLLKTSMFSVNNSMSILFRQLIGIKNGWRVRLKLVGRGITFFKRNNFIYMNIGRSHIVRFFLNSIIRIICFKKRITLISKDFNYLRKISFMLITAQPPLIYKAKGLIYDFITYRTKPGKIKQYRV